MQESNVILVAYLGTYTLRGISRMRVTHRLHEPPAYVHTISLHIEKPVTPSLSKKSCALPVWK